VKGNLHALSFHDRLMPSRMPYESAEIYASTTPSWHPRSAPAIFLTRSSQPCQSVYSLLARLHPHSIPIVESSSKEFSDPSRERLPPPIKDLTSLSSLYLFLRRTCMSSRCPALASRDEELWHEHPNLDCVTAHVWTAERKEGNRSCMRSRKM
jgi:hypothetical protein